MVAQYSALITLEAEARSYAVVCGYAVQENANRGDAVVAEINRLRCLFRLVRMNACTTLWYTVSKYIHNAMAKGNNAREKNKNKKKPKAAGKK